MAKFVIFLLLGLALARAAPGEVPAEITSTSLSNPSNPIINIEDETENQTYQIPKHYENDGTHNYTIYRNSSHYEKLMKEVKRIKELEHENMVLIWGNFGCGKTTLATLLTGGNLSSKSIGEDIGLFHLVDEDNRISHTIQYIDEDPPNVFHDKEHNTVYYDFPGVAEARPLRTLPSLAKIRNLVFTHVRSAKILLVVDHSTVIHGGIRSTLSESFNKLVMLADDLNLYGEAIAMVVNKVTNTYNKKDGHLELVSDKNVIRQVAFRLAEEKKSYENLVKSGALYNDDKTLNKLKIKLMEILLKHDNNTYERIGILRRPEEVGQVYDMKLFVEEREHIEHIVNDNLKYVYIE